EKPDLVWKGSSTYVNPNLFLFSLDSSSVEASKNLLHFNYVPKVNLFGDAGYVAMPTNFSVKKFGFSAGVSLAWNLYDGGKKNLQMQQLSVQQSTFSFYKSNYSLQLSMQLADLEKKLQSSNEIISQWQNQIKNTKQLLSLRRDQLETGQLSMIDYLILMRNYRDLQKNLIDATLKQQQIINEHNYLVW
ncbi:MAG: TolC family protein, partial [Chitinophagales bacterium]